MRIAALLALLVLVVLAGVFGEEPVSTFRDWLGGVDVIWAAVLVGLAYTPASLVLFPGWVLTVAAPALLGFWVSLVAVSLGSTLAAAVVFLVGRGLARSWVEAKVAGSPRFRALDRAVAEQGFRIVLLTRLSPVFPFTLLNYAFSLTRVSFRDYVLASWIGMFPGTVLYVYLGWLVKQLAMSGADLAEGREAENTVRT